VQEWKRSSFVMCHQISKNQSLVVEGREGRVFAGADPADPTRIRAVPIPEDVRVLCSD
jgi:4-hydroxybenzoyl-CoA thioesterase